MPGSGSDTSPFPNSDGQSSDALSNDEAGTARNRLTPENESGGESHSFNLLKILEEDWVKSEIGNPLVAAYHAGRLINAEEWLWLWLSVVGNLQHESLPGGVHAKLIEVAHRMAKPEKCEEVRRTLDFIHTDWIEWSRSEACLIAIESLDETLSSLDSSDRWTKAGQIIRLLENHLEPVQIVAMRLGRSVDQGIRQFRANSQQSALTFRRALIDAREPAPDLSWLGEARGICQQNNLFRKLLDDMPDVTIDSTPNNYVEMIDKIDRLIREALASIWRDKDAEYLGLRLNASRKTISRGGKGPFHVGKDFAVIKALCDKGGFVTHEAMEIIYRKKLMGKGVYPAAFSVRMIQLNVKLIPLDVHVKAQPREGWKLTKT
jgi:hypothetical protein